MGPRKKIIYSLLIYGFSLIASANENLNECVSLLSKLIDPKIYVSSVVDIQEKFPLTKHGKDLLDSMSASDKKRLTKLFNATRMPSKARLSSKLNQKEMGQVIEVILTHNADPTRLLLKTIKKPKQISITQARALYFMLNKSWWYISSTNSLNSINQGLLHLNFSYLFHKIIQNDPYLIHHFIHTLADSPFYKKTFDKHYTIELYKKYFSKLSNNSEDKQKVLNKIEDAFNSETNPYINSILKNIEIFLKSESDNDSSLTPLGSHRKIILSQLSVDTVSLTQAIVIGAGVFSILDLFLETYINAPEEKIIEIKEEDLYAQPLSEIDSLGPSELEQMLRECNSGEILCDF